MNLKGNVESIREVSYTAVDNFGKIEKGMRAREIAKLGYPENDKYIIFNKEGKKIEEIKYRIPFLNFGSNSSYELSSKTIFKYDLKGNIIEEIEYKSSGDVSRKTISSYNEDGDLIEELQFNADGSNDDRFTYKYEFINNCKIIERKAYDKNGNLIVKILFNYSENGKLLELIRYNSNGDLSGREIYKYNNIGKLAEENWISSGGSIYKIFIYKYDDKGDLVETKEYDGNINHIEGIMKYENGNIIEDSEFVNGNLRQRITYTYEFDKIGNWVKQTKFENTFPKYVIEREIKYFN